MNREMCLDEAKKCVCTDRNQQYGDPEDNFGVIAQLWEAYLFARLRKICTRTDDPICPTWALNLSDVSVLPSDVADLMVLFKIGRNATATVAKPDTYVDIAGYAACGCEVATE